MGYYSIPGTSLHICTLQVYLSLQESTYYVYFKYNNISRVYIHICTLQVYTCVNQCVNLVHVHIVYRRECGITITVNYCVKACLHTDLHTVN